MSTLDISIILSIILTSWISFVFVILKKISVAFAKPKGDKSSCKIYCLSTSSPSMICCFSVETQLSIMFSFSSRIDKCAFGNSLSPVISCFENCVIVVSFEISSVAI